MAELLQLRGVGHHAGPRTLFSGIDLTLARGDRMGLVGANGCGKSTLLKILAGTERPMEGQVTAPGGLRSALLDQEPDLDPEMSALDFVLRRLQQAPGPPPDQDPGVVARRSLGQAGFPDEDAKIASLSGGWRRRLALVAELATGAELILLDEPTNHLDLDGIEWLERSLVSSKRSLVVVSHDRRFLESVCTRMAEVDPRHPGGFFTCTGRYSDFLEQREQAFSDLREREASLNSQLREEIRYLRQGPKARTSKNATRVARAHENIAELERVRRVNRVQEIDAGFAETGRRTRRLVVGEQLTASPGDTPCFTDLDLVLGPGVRLGLVGPNGSGKTTLLRILMGEREPDAGSVRRAPDLRMVYFDQAREQLDGHETVRRALSPEGDTVVVGARSLHVKSWARQLLFRDEQLEQPVRTLSGGERARLLIARLMRTPADVLLLDEPTNDLDIPTLETLEQSLLEFEGAVVLVTHDRFLMERVCTSLLALDGQGGTREVADLAQWERTRPQPEAPAKPQAKPKPQAAARPQATTPGRLSYKEQRELSMMEETVLAAEAKLEELEAGVAAADPRDQHRIYEQINEVRQEIDALYARWAELDARA